MTYEHQDWPRDLIHKESGKRQEFKAPEDVPHGWFTVDGEEVNPQVEAQDDAGEQALRDIRGGGSDPKPRGNRRGKRHSEPVGSDPSVQDVEEPGGGSDG